MTRADVCCASRWSPTMSRICAAARSWTSYLSCSNACARCSAHVAFLDEGAFERWSKPTQRGTRRLAGIDLNKVPHRRSRPAADETVLRCHRVVGTEVGLRLVQLARNKVGPGTPGAPQTVAKGHSGPEHAL